ncbi:MAG: hypothetical protein KKB81_07505 [Candidatus Margulisbacteria bacterium]|nr:hypothetical protein [Candidatus Margulisiibacteriota bacterium]MBU1021197.1 hypothetical protein [Candidatus Margulisiibacteriota bacterium]MBU1729803.1 hypothetical protein [Candidatus Margulisiibacteriota bacterium]MBU1955304.1 hypothetical protein [Candidatus Margulisiibacteriota bacterium]
MSSSKRIQGKPVNISARLGQVATAMPIGIPSVLKRFWKFTRDMAQRFNKNLLKDREGEFLKVIEKDFKNR